MAIAITLNAQTRTGRMDPVRQQRPDERNVIGEEPNEMPKMCNNNVLVSFIRIWQRKCDDFYDVATVVDTTYINRRQ